MATGADHVQPRRRNSINKTGMGIPSSHNSTQPTLPSFPRPIVFTSTFIQLLLFSPSPAPLRGITVRTSIGVVALASGVISCKVGKQKGRDVRSFDHSSAPV